MDLVSVVQPIQYSGSNTDDEWLHITNLTNPYDGEIPIVVHLHGGEMPSGSDGALIHGLQRIMPKTGPGSLMHQVSPPIQTCRKLPLFGITLMMMV
jgi:hypothetical protein